MLRAACWSWQRAHHVEDFGKSTNADTITLIVCRLIVVRVSMMAQCQFPTPASSSAGVSARFGWNAACRRRNWRNWLSYIGTTWAASSAESETSAC